MGFKALDSWVTLKIKGRFSFFGSLRKMGGGNIDVLWAQSMFFLDQKVLFLIVWF